jgi:hypothetical protein
MTERLLQFIWQYRYYNPHELCIGTGEPLRILFPGELNIHQGPDFLQAMVRIGGNLWIGNIELHLLASGWDKHAHEEDRNYDNVILHVVWENDREAGHRGTAAEAKIAGKRRKRREGAAGRDIPVLVLQERVPKLLLGKYEDWMNSRSFVPCERQLPQAGEALWADWKKRLLIARLERKTLLIRDQLQQNRQHWEQTAWWLMARNFGLPVNAGAFAAIAQSLPLTILSRHRERPEQLEALLLGQAGLLAGDPGDDHALLLQGEFHHLRNKYRLRPIHEALLSMRMRPGNFPALRLAQLAGLLQRSCTWFGMIRDARSLSGLIGLLDSRAGSYWDWHYVPGKRSAFKVKHLGKQMKENILINTFLPLLYAYGNLHGEPGCEERALEWMRELGVEENIHTAGWSRFGVTNRHAADSQALLELKTRYCDRRICLDCAIGQALLAGITPERLPSS